MVHAASWIITMEPKTHVRAVHQSDPREKQRLHLLDFQRVVEVKGEVVHLVFAESPGEAVPRGAQLQASRRPDSRDLERPCPR